MSKRSKLLPQLLQLRVGGAGDALDRFEAAWNRQAQGGKPVSLSVLSFEDLPLLLKMLTPARWVLLERLRKEGAASIYELAKNLGRDYKNVHTDVARLADLGLVERRPDGALAVPWDGVRAELGF
jgi:predicted transcriptional regulator